uniref:Uncharacterized protein n=1 Tax=Cereibacter sphaeroides (strain ATCC 17025 / ATH 2.4.3) TaxID=349102 RepID=A4X0F9_CERS5
MGGPGGWLATAGAREIPDTRHAPARPALRQAPFGQPASADQRGRNIPARRGAGPMRDAPRARRRRDFGRGWHDGSLRTMSAWQIRIWEDDSAPGRGVSE